MASVNLPAMRQPVGRGLHTILSLGETVTDDAWHVGRE